MKEPVLPSPALPPCSVYLIRHGATGNNLTHPPRLQGCGIDAELSAEGRRQAERTAAFLASRRLEAVYSSPLLRARQTAEAIATAAGVAVELCPEIHEADLGQWEGRTWPEVERLYPEQYAAFLRDASVHPYLGGETLEQVRARAVPALEQIVAENAGRTVAIVAHNIVNRVYLAQLLEVPLPRYRLIPQDNCGITVLEHRNGHTQVVTVNGLWHLQEH